MLMSLMGSAESRHWFATTEEWLLMILARRRWCVLCLRSFRRLKWWPLNENIAGGVSCAIMGLVSSLMLPCALLLTESVYLCWYDSRGWWCPVCYCFQGVRFCINRVSFRLLITIADHPLCICAHRKCVSASTECHSHRWSSLAHLFSQRVRFCINRVSFRSLITIADHPLCIYAHSMCVFASTECHSCHWSSLVHLCLQGVRICIHRAILLLLIIPFTLLIECVYFLLCCIILIAHILPFHYSF